MTDKDEESKKVYLSLEPKLQDKISITLKANPPAKQIVSSQDQEYLKIKVKSDGTVASLMEKLRKNFSDVVKDQNFIFYCGNNFAISPHTVWRDLYNNFKVGNELIISYNIIETWG